MMQNPWRDFYVKTSIWVSQYFNINAMIKLISILILHFQTLAPLSLRPGDVTVEHARQLYFSMDVDECNGLKLAEEFEEMKSVTNPVLKAYYGASAASAPACLGSPMKKLSWFNKGKDLLDQSIKSGMSIFEIRFLRFATQSKTPRFLNYRDNIQEDKKFILENLPKGKSELKDNRIFGKMTSFLMDSDELNEKEKTLVKEFLDK